MYGPLDLWLSLFTSKRHRAHSHANILPQPRHSQSARVPPAPTNCRRATTLTRSPCDALSHPSRACHRRIGQSPRVPPCDTSPQHPWRACHRRIGQSARVPPAATLFLRLLPVTPSPGDALAHTGAVPSLARRSPQPSHTQSSARAGTQRRTVQHVIEGAKRAVARARRPHAGAQPCTERRRLPNRAVARRARTLAPVPLGAAACTQSAPASEGLRRSASSAPHRTASLAKMHGGTASAGTSAPFVDTWQRRKRASCGTKACTATFRFALAFPRNQTIAENFSSEAHPGKPLRGNAAEIEGNRMNGDRGNRQANRTRSKMGRKGGKGSGDASDRVLSQVCHIPHIS